MVVLKSEQKRLEGDLKLYLMKTDYLNENVKYLELKLILTLLDKILMIDVSFLNCIEPIGA